MNMILSLQDDEEESTIIRERTFQELLLQKIITEGVIAIAAGLHPGILDRKLKSFLTPSARKGQVISIARIKERFEVKELNREAELAADGAVEGNFNRNLRF